MVDRTDITPTQRKYTNLAHTPLGVTVSMFENIAGSPTLRISVTGLMHPYVKEQSGSGDNAVYDPSLLPAAEYILEEVGNQYPAILEKHGVQQLEGLDPSMHITADEKKYDLQLMRRPSWRSLGAIKVSARTQDAIFGDICSMVEQLLPRAEQILQDSRSMAPDPHASAEEKAACISSAWRDGVKRGKRGPPSP